MRKGLAILMLTVEVSFEMAKRMILVACVVCVSAHLASEVLDSAVLEQRRVASVSLSAFPLVPAASQVSFSRKILEPTPSVDATLYAWYLVTTPFLIPGPFFEFGVMGLVSYMFDWGLGLQSGIGGAIFDEDGLFGESPFVAVIPLSAWYRIVDGRWYAILQSETLVYSNGFIADAEVGVSYSILPSLLSASVAGGVNVGYQAQAKYAAIVPKMVLSVAVGF